MKIIEIDSSKCIGCKACVLACSLAKTKAFSYENAVIKIVKDESKALCQINSCSNCTTRECIKTCPFEAIKINENYGIPVIDYDKCTECGLCVKSCPYGIIKIENESKKVYKCDFCSGAPACALACVPKAIRVIETDI